MDDDDLFAKAMSVVRPIAPSDKVTVEKPRVRKPRLKQRRSPAAIALTDHRNAAPESGREPWILKASGVSQEKLKQLGAGRPAVDIETDLHGMTREEALSALEKMLEIALDEQARALCIVHGRGLHSQGRPVLKDTVYQWLRSGPYAGHILAAIPKPHTGGGSCLVLLRRKRSR